MSELRFRQGHGIDPFREWARRELPQPEEGLVISDLDYAFRRYGEMFFLDGLGDLMLIEKKEMTGTQTEGQKRIYNWIDTAIKTGDYGDRWRGRHLFHANYSKPCPICPRCHQPFEDRDSAYERLLSALLKWNGMEITHARLKEILLGRK